MFERFTDEAIATITIAQQEAQSLRQNLVSSELMLLGLMGLRESPAADVLRSFGLTFTGVLEEVETVIEPRVSSTAAFESTKVFFTITAQIILERAILEARQFNQEQVIPEHLLLAIANLPGSGAAHILRNLAIDPVKLQQRTIQTILRMTR
jgi:ATP-dependent Clp protease ATP-binding subunit ClpC